MDSWKSKIILITAIITLSTISACTSIGSNDAEGAAADDSIILSMKNNETTITVKPGETFTVQLDGNITTGYAWEVEEIDTILLMQVGEMEYKEKSDPDSSSAEDLTGAPGEFVFTFKALQIGETPLRLIYYRSFEKDVEPLETFMVTVNISE